MLSYTWGQLREVSADSLAVGDTFVIPIAGTVCRVAKDGSVSGYAIGHSEMALQVAAVFTIMAQDADSLTGRRHDGVIVTSKRRPGATVLRLER